MKTTVKKTPKKNYEVEHYKSKNGEYSWRLKSPNGQILCGPCETFKTKRAAQNNFIKSASGILLRITPKEFLNLAKEVFNQTGFLKSDSSAIAEIIGSIELINSTVLKTNSNHQKS